jgi:ADP-heptose:LPS heptosyltransferase
MGDKRRRVLFVTGGSIGDAALTSGLLAHFVDSEPDAWFTVAAGPAAASLFAETPRLEALIPIVKRRRGLHWLDLWRRVAGRRWSAVVDMRGSGLAYFLRAERRFVYRRERRPADAPPLHKALEAARTIGLLDRPPALRLYASAKTEALAEALVGGARPILAIAPAATWPPKTWPAERFAEAALALLDPSGPLAGGRALLVGGAGDAAIFAPIRAALPPSRIIDVIGQELLTVYACFKRARLFIGNDSGPMHLAAAAGAPTLGLFGPSDERLYGPWGPRTAVARGTSFDDYQALLATPANRGRLMTGLEVAAVVAAARALLERTREVESAPVDGAEAAS